MGKAFVDFMTWSAVMAFLQPLFLVMIANTQYLCIHLVGHQIPTLLKMHVNFWKDFWMALHYM